MSWLRLDEDVLSDPRVVEATIEHGPLAPAAWLFTLTTAKKANDAGRVELSPLVLARDVRADVAEARAVIGTLLRVGLVTATLDADVYEVPNWPAYQPDPRDHAARAAAREENPGRKPGRPRKETGDTGAQRIETVGIGIRDVTGQDRTKEGAKAPVALDDRRRQRIDPVEQVFAAWIASTGRDRVRLDDKRRRLIRRALDDYPLDDVVAAVDGWRHSPHHRGENDRHTVYNDLSLLLRNGEHVERFRDYTLGGLSGTGVRGPDNAARVEELMRGMRPPTPHVRQIGKGT